MNEAQLQDRLHWGLNRAANILGRTADAYRPRGCGNPVNLANRYLRLHAAFTRADAGFSRAVSYGVAEWCGIFDAAYTRVGDYLVQDHHAWFIIAQQPLLPVLCIKANRVVSIARSVTAGDAAALDASGSQSMTRVISDWPASVLGIETEGRSLSHLPGDTAIPAATVLLPSTHGKRIQRADLVTDDQGTTSLVVSSELSDLGWRLNIRQVTT